MFNQVKRLFVSIQYTLTASKIHSMYNTSNSHNGHTKIINFSSIQIKLLMYRLLNWLSSSRRRYET